MKKWMLLLSLVLMIVIVNCGQAQAAEETATKDITFEELNDENVFIKQSYYGEQCRERCMERRRRYFMDIYV